MQGQPISMVDFVEETLLSDLSFDYSCFWFQPILRDAFEKDPSMSLEEARQVITKCLQVLFYRDARSLNKVCITFCTMLNLQGVTFRLCPKSKQLTMDVYLITVWNCSHYKWWCCDWTSNQCTNQLGNCSNGQVSFNNF